MKKQPLVSIIIPTYNDGNCVGDAIDCSLSQTYENIEVIVVDDGSTDGTERLLHDRYENRIKYIRQENKGLSSARNTGIKSANGDYFQFLDADDVIDDSKISEQMDKLTMTSGLALAYCDYIRSDMNDRLIEYKRMNPVLQNDKPIEDLAMKWETEVSIPPHCFLFRSTIFTEGGIRFDEKLPTHEDWDCWMNVFAMNPEVVYVDKALANYRVRSNSMCSNNLKMRNGYLQAIDKQIRKHEANSELVSMLKKRRKQIKYLYREAGLLMRLFNKCHPVLKNCYIKIVPWRIQRIFD